MAVLKLIKGTTPGQLFQLLEQRMVMGRHPSCQIVLDNAAVSRNHAQILESHGTYFLEDLRSRNGTLLNGEPIQGRTELKDGDELRVCEVVLRFYQRMPPPDPLAAAAAEMRTLEQPAPAVSPPVIDSFNESFLQDDGTDSSSIITSLEMGPEMHPRIAVRPEAKLRAVMEISRNLARTLKPEEILPRILDSLFKIFSQADRGFIVLKDPASGQLQVKAMKMRRESMEESSRLSTTILKGAMEKGRAILSADAATDSRFSLSESIANLRIRSVMCAPLVALGGESLGAIQVDTLDSSLQFAEEDLEVLVSVASQAALGLENAQLHAATLRQRDLERDLDFATQVQLGFLPKERPKVAGYEFFDFYEAAQRVGGDLFDYVMLPGGRVAVSVGDVAGKGVPAALMMARVYSDARYELLAQGTPAEAMSSLNARVCSGGIGNSFITFAIAVLDPKAHTVTIINAGHLPPLLRAHKGDVQALATKVSSLPLGVSSDTVYAQTQVKIAAGDSLVMFTDGVTEAMNQSKELYGTSRLSACIKSAPPQAEPLGEAIVADVEKFCEGQPQRDDICLLCFHRKA